jgi:hypothetical protein
VLLGTATGRLGTGRQFYACKNTNSNIRTRKRRARCEAFSLGELARRARAVKL